MAKKKDPLANWKAGVTNPPENYGDAIPVSVELHGYSDACVAQHVSIYLKKDSVVDLSHYVPSLNLVLKVCEKE